MGTTAWIVTVAVIIVVVAVAASVGVGGHRRRQMQDLFGPDGGGSVGDLTRPRASVDNRLELRRLEPATAGRYRAEWEQVQAGFVDRPAMALHEADTLVSAVMIELGYPVEQLDRMDGSTGAAPSPTVERYQAIRRVNLRADSSETTTDELRQAFVHYRDLLDHLLRPSAVPVENPEAPAGRVGDAQGPARRVRPG